MAGTADDQIGKLLPYSNLDGKDDIYSGERSLEYWDWRTRHLAAGHANIVAGFTHAEALLLEDRGSIKGPSLLGSVGDAIRVKDEQDHRLRKRTSSARLQKNLAPDCAVRRQIAKTPELAQCGAIALAYLDSKCGVKLSRTDLEAKWDAFLLYDMEEERDPSLYDADSAAWWCAFVDNKWEQLPSELQKMKGLHEKLRVMINGFTNKIGQPKADLLADECEAKDCAWTADHAARAFDGTTTPITFAADAVKKGQFRDGNVQEFLDRKWRAGIRSEQIFLKKDRVRFVRRNGRDKKTFDRSKKSSDRGSRDGRDSSRRTSAPALPVGDEPKLNLRCYNCGGIFHVASVCPTPKGCFKRSFLMEIRYPRACTEAGAAWPDSWSSGEKTRMAGECDECDQDEGQQSDEGAVPDEDGETSDSEDVPVPERTRFVRNGAEVQYVTDGLTQGSFAGVVRVVRKLTLRK